MATQAYSLFTYNGKRQLADSSTLDILFKSLAVGTLAAGLVISNVAGAFDFNNKPLGNINGVTLAGGTVTGLPSVAAGATDAVSKAHLDTQLALKVAKAGDSMTGNLDFGGAYKVTGLAVPTAAGDAVTKAYADAIQVAARIQENVAAASTANVSISSAPATIDGYTLVAGDRVLLKNQTDPKQNLIYDFTAAGSALTLDPSLNNTPGNDIYNGVLVPRVQNGSQAGTSWIISSKGTGTGGVHTIGTDGITWGQFATPANFTGGPGIWLNGMAITANVDGITLDLAGATANGSATIEIKPLGVGTAQLAALSVTAAKLATGAVTQGKVDSTIVGAGLQVTGSGATTAIAANPDGVTLDAAGGTANGQPTLEVKAGGISSTQLAASAVTAGKVAAGALGAALALDGSNKIAVQTSTEIGIRVNGSNQLQGDYDRTLTNGTATAISVGQLVYVDGTGNIAGLALASVANLDAYEVFIATAAIAGSGTGRCLVRVGGIAQGYTGLTPGKRVYVSRSSAGGITQDPTTATGGFVSGENVYMVGRAISATEIRFQPNFEWQYA